MLSHVASLSVLFTSILLRNTLHIKVCGVLPNKFVNAFFNAIANKSVLESVVVVMPAHVRSGSPALEVPPCGAEIIIGKFPYTY